METFKRNQLHNLPDLVLNEDGEPQAGAGKPNPPSYSSVPQPPADRPPWGDCSLRAGMCPVPGTMVAESHPEVPANPGWGRLLALITPP